MEEAPLSIRLLGAFEVRVGGQPMRSVRTRSVEWLLALLVLRHGRDVSRSWLAGTLWPQSREAQALFNLRRNLMELRQALGAQADRLRTPNRATLALDLTGAVADVVDFDAAIAAGDERSLEAAVALYRGPLLEGCVEEWAFSEQATRAEQLLTALETLAERAAGRGDHGEAIQYLRRAQALDPLRDTLPRRLMTSLAAAGDPAAAIQTYRDFRIRLQEELAAAPDEATTRLFHELRAAARRQAGYPLAGGRRLAPAPAPDPATGAAEVPRPVPEPLPRPLTSLIGREQEMAQIQAALEQGRLVTLVGGGGVGKTRLALEVALQAGDESPGGAAWVELGPLADGALLLPSVAAALGIRDDASGDANALTRQLVARLAEGAPLLVLDNCEHLLDAAAAVVQMLLQRCPDLRVLATSRQRLGLPGEVAWRVPSLPAPGPERLPVASDAAVAAALGFAAVRLFVERAAAVHPGFRLASGAEAAAVGLICHRLDGIPLAIELAAARVTVLPVAQIAARLDDRFKLLTRGTRGALPRHQTLQALIDWSYDSLPKEEAVLLRRLSVFAGGWTLEAAEAVCSGVQAFGPSGVQDPQRQPDLDSAGPERLNAERLNADDVLDLLDSLVDRSLVLVDEVAEGLRYRMLETVREYAREKLAASGELAAVRNRHRDWYLRLAEQSEAEFMSLGRGAAWWARLKAELDNLRAALAWCEAAAAASPAPPGTPAVGEGYPAPGDAAEAGLRLADTLYWVRSRCGYPIVDPLLLERALVRNSAAPAPLRARAFFRAAGLALSRGSSESATSYLQSARQGYEEILTQACTERDRSGAAGAVLGLAAVTYTMGDKEAAWSYGMEARQRMAELGDRLCLVESLEWLARVAVIRGDLGAARPLLEERLAVCRELGDSHLLIHALGGMGHLVREEGDYARARALYQESLLHRQKEGHQIALAQSLEDLAVLASREQQAEQATRLLGAAEAFCETIGAIVPVADHTDYERTVAAGRAALGEAAFAAAWAEGRTMSLEEAVEYALLAPQEPPPAA